MDIIFVNELKTVEDQIATAILADVPEILKDAIENAGNLASFADQLKADLEDALNLVEEGETDKLEILDHVVWSTE